MSACRMSSTKVSRGHMIKKLTSVNIPLLLYFIIPLDILAPELNVPSIKTPHLDIFFLSVILDLPHRGLAGPVFKIPGL